VINYPGLQRITCDYIHTPSAPTPSKASDPPPSLIPFSQVSSQCGVNKMTAENLAATVGVNLLRKSEAIEAVSMQRIERERHVIVDLITSESLFAQPDRSSGWLTSRSGTLCRICYTLGTLSRSLTWCCIPHWITLVMPPPLSFAAKLVKSSLNPTPCLFSLSGSCPSAVTPITISMKDKFRFRFKFTFKFSPL
jgi:hypothetical protein